VTVVARIVRQHFSNARLVEEVEKIAEYKDRDRVFDAIRNKNGLSGSARPSRCSQAGGAIDRFKQAMIDRACGSSGGCSVPTSWHITFGT